MDIIQLARGTELHNGSYCIERVLGQGGFGITYLAVDTINSQYVAIKEFFPKDYCDRDSTTSHVTIGTTLNTQLVYKLKEKFLREVRNVARLQNEHIVSVYDVFEENDTAYYVMEYIEGNTAKEIVENNGALAEEEALELITPIAGAVEYMHSMKMNHLDIKPGNIMVRKDNNCPVLIDFGSSKQYDKEGDATSSMMPGLTHGYAPMEQYRPGGVAQFTPQTDVYALGATLLYLLTGRKPPHYSEIMEEGLPTLPSEVSETTITAIEHAMKPRRMDRPETVTHFLQELPKVERKEKITPPDGQEVSTHLDTDTERETSNSDETVLNNDRQSIKEEPYADNGEAASETAPISPEAMYKLWQQKEKERKIIDWGVALASSIFALIIFIITIYDSSKYSDQYISSSPKTVTNLNIHTQLYGDITYTGEVDEEGQPHNTGKAIFHSGDAIVYDGQWKHGLMHGKGKQELKEGDTYEGKYEDGYYSDGRYTYGNNGDFYEGTFYREYPMATTALPYNGKEYSKAGHVLHTYVDGKRY